MTRVRLKETVWLVSGRAMPAGSEWDVVRDFETHHGPRLALGDATGIVCAAMPLELVEILDDART